MQKLIKGCRIDAANGFVARDKSFVRHIDGDPQGRFGCALA